MNMEGISPYIERCYPYSQPQLNFKMMKNKKQKSTLNIKTMTTQEIKVPDSDFYSFSDEDKKVHEVIGLTWKHEGSAGPLYVVFKAEEYDSFWERTIQVARNYRDSDQEKHGGGFYAEWFTLGQAHKIAKKLNVEVETV